MSQRAARMLQALLEWGGGRGESSPVLSAVAAPLGPSQVGE